MTVFNTLNKKTMIAMMIAATGLSTSMAAAQFKVDYSSKTDNASTAKENQEVTIIQSHDDEHKYEIKIVDGNVVVAKIDGDDIGKDQYKFNDNVIVFISKDGETIHELKLPKKHKDSHSWTTSSGDHSWTSSSDNVIKIDGKDGMFVVKSDFAPKDGAKFKKIWNAKEGQPKVMLGINLGEPSAVLRKHLKLKDGMHAILVEKVIDGLPAQAAGLQDYDVIVSIDGSDQASGEILGKILAEKEAGDTMKVIVIRNGDKVKLKVKLAEYDGEALGNIKVTTDILDDENTERQFEFKVLDLLEDGEFGEIQGLKLEKLKEHLHLQLREFEKSGEHREIEFEMRAKAMDAMKHAERQMLELRDGKLFVHSANELKDQMNHLKGELRELHVQAPQAIHGHMEGMEDRLNKLEDRLDRQINEMSEQMDRMMNMFERLMDRLDD